MKKPNYNAETQTGISNRGNPFRIINSTRRELSRDIPEYNLRANRGGVIVCDSMDEAIERAKHV